MWFCLANYRCHKLNFAFRILQLDCDKLDPKYLQSLMLIGYVVLSIVASIVFVSMKYFGHTVL